MPFTRFGVRSLLLFVLGIFLSGVHHAHALQAVELDSTPHLSEGLSPSPEYTDTLRTIIVFAKFADDNSPGDATVNFRDWPVGLSDIPAFGHKLLSPRLGTPYPDSSLSEYFRTQSNDNFAIWGNAFPTVYTSRYPEDHYHKPLGGYGNLTLEIVAHLDRQGVDFGGYDENQDGILDNLVVILRSDSRRDDKTMTWTGISCLDARCGGGISGGKALDAAVVDGITVDWNLSGSIIFNRTPGNVSPYWYHIRMLAHELGHDIWNRYFNHIPAFRSNDVPLTSNRGAKSSCIGYALMAGAGGAPDCGGDITISAFERDLLGWINCKRTDAKSDQAFVLSDLVDTNDCVIIETGNARQKLFLSNRQRQSIFDQLRTGGIQAQYDLGLLRTTGLLVMRSNSRQLDVIPADNSLDLSSQSSVYQGDMFGGKFRQLTPFTRPNINGFTEYRRGLDPDYFAIDDIQIMDSSHRSISFNILADFRINPVIRSDSWIGAVPESQHTWGKLRITAGAVLTINSTNYTHSGDIVVDPGGTLILSGSAALTINHCGSIRLGPGATLENSGTIRFSGTLLTVSESQFVQKGQLRIDMSGCQSRK